MPKLTIKGICFSLLLKIVTINLDILFYLGKCALPACVSDTVEKSAAICARFQEPCLYGTANTQENRGNQRDA